MVKFYPELYVSLGEADKNSFYVKNPNGDWINFDHYETFRVKKKQNQMSEFEVKIYDIQDAEKVYFKEQAEVLFYAGTTLILKGRIQTIEYGTSYECTAKGYGMESLLLSREFVKTGEKRVEYSEESAQTIAKEILSLNSDGASPFIINPAVAGLFETDYGNIYMRFEYANRLKALGDLTNAINYEWWVSTDPGFRDFFNIAPYQGNQSGHIKTFNISTNCVKTSQEKDTNNLTNYIDILGYGDGINQLKTSTYAASTVYSALASDITSSGATISLVDASSFDSSGTVRIMEEQITYAGKSGNDLTGCTRGANSTTAKAHKKGVYTEKYFASNSPESGSPISTYGLMDYTITDKTIINEQTLELIASRYLLERMTPIIRIALTPDEPMTDASLSVGDKVTVVDPESGISGDYRIVGIDYEDSFGSLSLTFEISNRSLEFVEQVQKSKEQVESISKYMQGATNIYAITEISEGDASTYINIRFYMPEEAVAINKVLLNFKMKPVKTFQTISNSAVDTFTGTLTTSGWEDTGGSVTVTTASANDKILIIYSADIGNQDPPNILMTFKIQRDIGGGGYSDLANSDSYYGGAWQAGDNTYTKTVTLAKTLLDSPGSGTITYKVQAKDFEGKADYGVFGNGVITALVFSTSFQEGTLTGESVDIYVGEDGGAMTLKGTYTEDQSNLDITSLVSNVGTSKWINLQFRPNQEMRIEANAYVQIFLESK
jgi:hypothetical protein